MNFNNPFRKGPIFKIKNFIIMQKIAYEYINDYFQDIRGRYPPQGIKLLLQWPPPQTEMFPEQKSIWILVISLPYLEALKLFNLYLVLCVWLVDHLQENMCKFSWTTYLQFHNFTKSRIHEITQSIIHKGCSACIWYFFPEFIKLQIHELYSTCMYLVLWNTNSKGHGFTRSQVDKFTNSRIRLFMTQIRRLMGLVT